MIVENQDDGGETYKRIQRNFRLTAVVALIVLLVGVVFYHHVEQLNWLDAVYFCTITLTTIGYGDIVPHTDAGKLFTIFYVIIGVGIIATFVNLLIKNAIARREIKRHSKTKRKDDTV